jgi:hypothetical protein
MNAGFGRNEKLRRRLVIHNMSCNRILFLSDKAIALRAATFHLTAIDPI